MSEPRSKPAAPSWSTDGESSPIRVLVASDDVGLLRSLASLLRSRGLRVSTAEDALAALASVARDPPDVALVDAMSSDVAGLDLLARLKAAGAPLEVIVMTAVEDVGSAAGAMRDGAYAVLTRPFHSSDAVAHAVVKAAERRRLQSRAEHLAARLLAKAPLAPAPSPRSSVELAEHEGRMTLPPELLEATYADAKKRMQSLFDDAYTREILRRSEGNLSEAARRAGLDRSNFRRILRRRRS